MDRLSPTANSIYESLRIKILNNEISIGTHLKERELAEKYNVSRTVIKSVLNCLSSNGLVDLVAYRGARTKGLSRKEFVDLYQVRASLEKLAAELFCLSASNKDMDRLQENIRKSQYALSINDINLYKDLDIKFHNNIIMGSCNSGLIDIFKNYIGKPDIYRSFLFLENEAQISFNEHKNLYNMIKLRDSIESGKIMEKHIKRTLNEYEEFLKIDRRFDTKHNKY